MTNKMNRPRFVSTPIAPMKLRELNKYRDKKICKEDLEIFIEKYRKESKVLNFLRGLPPEITIIKNIANRYNGLVTQRTPICAEDRELLAQMILMNKEFRAGKSCKLRLRDSIIDRMISYFSLEDEIKYESLQDYI